MSTDTLDRRMVQFREQTGEGTCRTSQIPPSYGHGSRSVRSWGRSRRQANTRTIPPNEGRIPDGEHVQERRASKNEGLKSQREVAASWQTDGCASCQGALG